MRDTEVQIPPHPASLNLNFSFLRLCIFSNVTVKNIHEDAVPIASSHLNGYYFKMTMRRVCVKVSVLSV